MSQTQNGYWEGPKSDDFQPPGNRTIRSVCCIMIDLHRHTLEPFPALSVYPNHPIATHGVRKLFHMHALLPTRNDTDSNLEKEQANGVYSD